MLAGAIVLLGPVLLKTRLGVDEVVTTLLFNFIMLLFFTEPPGGQEEGEKRSLSKVMSDMVDVLGNGRVGGRCRNDDGQHGAGHHGPFQETVIHGHLAV